MRSISLFLSFRSFREWPAFSNAENEFFQAGSSYTDHLKRAFGPNFLPAHPSAHPFLAQIQQTAESLIRLLEDCDRELITFRKDLSELEQLHSNFQSKRREFEQIEAKEREAMKRSATAERNLVDVKKRSSNASEVRQAQQDFDGAVASERESKKEFDRSHCDFQQSRLRYEKDVVQLLAVNLGAQGNHRGRTLKQVAEFGKQIATEAAMGGLEMEEEMTEREELQKLREKVNKNKEALEEEERMGEDFLW
jgi:hypothetical protein